MSTKIKTAFIAIMLTASGCASVATPTIGRVIEEEEVIQTITESNCSERTKNSAEHPEYRHTCQSTMRSITAE